MLRVSHELGKYPQKGAQRGLRDGWIELWQLACFLFVNGWNFSDIPPIRGWSLCLLPMSVRETVTALTNTVTYDFWGWVGFLGCLLWGKPAAIWKSDHYSHDCPAGETMCTHSCQPIGSLSCHPWTSSPVEPLDDCRLNSHLTVIMGETQSETLQHSLNFCI